MISVRTVVYLFVMLLTVASATGLPVLIDACCVDAPAEQCVPVDCCSDERPTDEPCCDPVLNVHTPDTGASAKEASIPSPVLSLDQTVTTLTEVQGAAPELASVERDEQGSRYRCSVILTPAQEHTGSFLI